MKSKEEVIQIAYDGEKYDWDENGWLTYGVYENSEFGYEPFGDYETRNHIDGVYEWRPKSLQGIEDNNGWIIKDLEKANFIADYYWIKKKDGDEEIAFFAPHRNCFGGIDGDIYISDVTHYQPIKKPNPPLY